MNSKKRYPLPLNSGSGQVKAASLVFMLLCLTACDNRTENDLTNRVTQDGLGSPVLFDAIDASNSDSDDKKINSENVPVDDVPAEVVYYDIATDKLSIQVQDVLLRRLLVRITFQSGIETWIGEDFDPVISADIEAQPLETALKQLLKNINYVMHYGKNQQGETLVTGVEILQAGSESGNGVSAVSIYTQSSLMAKRYASSKTLTIVQQRWQQRLAAMPEVKRMAVEADYLKKVEVRKKADMEFKQRKAEDKQTDKQYRLKKKQRNEALLAADPEFYQMRKERREEMRQQYLREQSAGN